MEPESSLRHSQVPISCPYSELDQSSPGLYPNYWRSILILSFHLRLGLPSCLSFRFPHQNLVYTSPLPHMFYMPRYLILLDLITRVIFDEEYRSLNYSLWSFLCPLLPRPVRPKHFLQHPISTHPQSTFLPQCERPWFTPIQDNKQNWNSVNLNLYTFG